MPELPLVQVAGAYVAALVAALLVIRVCRRFAIRFGYVAKPKEDRWHRKQTALLGGVGIAAVVLVGSAALRPFSDIALFVATGAGIALVGLVDDLITLKPYSKLVAQIALASAFLAFGYRLHWMDSLTLDTMLTLVWLVGVTNAFNLLDNMDGLCAGVALIVAASLMLGFVETGQMWTHATYLALLMGALSGFLVYNINPASIFMGDSGSLFIGLTLAGMALYPTTPIRADSSLLSIVGGPALVLLIPIFDTALVTVLRLLAGRSPSQGGRDHSSHRLVVMGLSERAAVRVLWTLAALGGLLGFALRTVQSDIAALLAFAFVLAMMIFAVSLAHVRVYANHDTLLLRGGKVTPLIVELMYKRRIAEVLLDMCLVPLCYYGAYRLRFEGDDFRLYFPTFLQSLPLIVGIQIAALYLMGGYRGIWRHFGLMDGVAFAKGVALGTASAVIAVLYLYRFENYSRGVFIIYASLLMLALCGSRASFRLIGEFVRRRRAGMRLIIYGAGDGAALAVRELLSDVHGNYRMVGFIDDDVVKQKTRLHGYPVLGGFATLTTLVESGAVEMVVVSARSMGRERLQQLEAICAEHGVALSRLHFRFEQLVAS